MALTDILLGVMLLFGIAAPLIGWLIIRKMEIKTTDTIIIFEDTKRTNGCYIGSLISKEVGKNGRIKLKYLPRDLENPKVQEILIESTKIDIIPKGVKNPDRNIIKVLPEDVISYHASVLNRIEKINAENHIIMAQKIGLDRQQAHLEELGEGELSRQDIGLKNSFIESLTKQKSKDDSRSSIKPGYVNPNTTRDIFN